jgi:hypothetical protein
MATTTNNQRDRGDIWPGDHLRQRILEAGCGIDR